MSLRKELNFAIPQSQVTKNHRFINWPLVQETLFVLPCNDGEAKRACQILRAITAPFVHVSKQAWGATLDKELANLAPELLAQVKRLVIFEMPGKAAQVGETIAAEEDLRQQGLELVIVDHHYYRWVDRYQPASSLEQLCRIIGWPMDGIDQMIAVNDRSYIPGLKKLGLCSDEILQVRFYDLEAQGYSRSYIESQRKAAQREINRLEADRQGLLWVISKTQVEKVFLIQELALQSDDGIVHLFEQADHKLSFSGSPAVVNGLMALEYPSYGLEQGYVYYGGGDGDGSKYWGFRLASHQKKLPEAFLQAVLCVVSSRL